MGMIGAGFSVWCFVCLGFGVIFLFFIIVWVLLFSFFFVYIFHDLFV